MSKYMGQIMAECDCQHQACEVRGHCLADYIKELEAQLVGMSVSHWQVDAMQQNALLHDSLTRAESAEAKLAQIEGELLRRVKHAEDCKKAAGSGTSQRREHYRMHALSEALGAVRKIVKGEKRNE